MSVFHTHTVTCKCGKSFEANLVRTVNTQRFPKARQQIIAGDFHCFRCPGCRRTNRIEKDFFYADFERNTFFFVKASWDRHLWRESSAELRRGLEHLPEKSAASHSRYKRLIFGLAELREKLIAQDAGIDDRVVEMMKVLVIYEHPFLIQKPRLGLYLHLVSEDNFEFIAQFDHQVDLFSVCLPRGTMDPLVETGVFQTWADQTLSDGNLFKLQEDDWVNMWRWSPKTWALSYLSGFAQAAKNKDEIDTKSREFEIMLQYLPRGSQLPSHAKRELRLVFEQMRQRRLGKMEDALFEIRFEIELEDDWHRNRDPDDIDTIWNLLKDLPDTNVEGNSRLAAINLEGGKDDAWYSSETDTIGIGSKLLGAKEKFEDYVRHEVGHAVHEEQLKKINAWIEGTFGWQVFKCTNAGIDGWVDAMGGWDSWGKTSQAERAQVRSFMRQIIGTEAWESGPEPAAALGHAWNRPEFGPKLAYECSLHGNRWWWENSSTWYRVKDKVFSPNYYYKTLMVVSVNTIKLIAKMPDSYAAMSPAEFFAELYALFYDLDDPQRESIPAKVVNWMKRNIGRPEPGGD